MAINIPNGYYDKVATAESGGNPFAASGSSSAFGLFQFTKSTFTGLGYDWSSRFDVATQWAAMEKATGMNAAALQKAGLSVTSENLYAYHFFGPSTGGQVLKSADNTSLSSILSAQVLNANPFLKSMSVGDLKQWLNKKMGGTGAGVEAPNEGGILSSAASAVSDVVNAPGNILEWITNFFSYKTAGRFAAVFIGVLLVGLAVAALVLTSDISPKNIVEKAVS